MQEALILGKNHVLQPEGSCQKDAADGPGAGSLPCQSRAASENPSVYLRKAANLGLKLVFLKHMGDRRTLNLLADPCSPRFELQ